MTRWTTLYTCTGHEISPEAAADALEAERRVVTGLDEDAAAAAAAAEAELPPAAAEVEGANLALPLRPPEAPLVEGESEAAAADPEPPLPLCAAVS